MAGTVTPERPGPDPQVADDVPGFIAQLRLLRVWAGSPSFQELHRRTGLPRSTIADALSLRRRGLPSIDIVIPLVRACGGDAAQVDRWRDAWRRVQAAATATPKAATAPAPAAAGSAGSTADARRRGPLAVVPHQLPPVPGGFHGRAGELAALDEALAAGADADAARLVLVTGTAGVGKTALALRWAHAVAERFDGGQLFLHLRGFGGAAPLAAHDALGLLLTASGVPGDAIPSDPDGRLGLYRSVTAGRRLLVFLDDARDPAQVRHLIPGAGCLVVVTSRDRLDGLVARDGARRVVVGRMDSADAVGLLRASIGPRSVEAEPDAAADLAAACGYLPLALRIAAAHAMDPRWRTLGEYTEALRTPDRLAALDVPGDPDAAVRPAFDVSYRALRPQARRLFRLLGVQPGRDLAPEGVAVLLGEPAGAREALAELHVAHLVEPADQDRFGMHDLLVLYARERSADEDAGQHRSAAVARLLGWYLARADAAAHQLYPGFRRLPVPPADSTAGLPDGVPVAFADTGAALSWLDAEAATLVTVIQTAAGLGFPRHAWLLADVLRGYFHIRMATAFWPITARAGLDAAVQAGDDEAQAAMWLNLGTVAWATNDLDAAEDAWQRSLEIARRTDDLLRQAGLLNNLGMLSRDRDRLDRAAGEYLASMEAFRGAGDAYGEITALNNLSSVRRELGLLAEAREDSLRAAGMAREIGDRMGESNGLHYAGTACLESDRLPEAAELLRQALDLSREIGNTYGEVFIRARLAQALAGLGRAAEARELADGVLAAARDLEGGEDRAELLTCAADVALRLGDARQALRLQREALRAGGTSVRQSVAALLGAASAASRLGHPGFALDWARRAERLAADAGLSGAQARARTLARELSATP